MEFRWKRDRRGYCIELVVDGEHVSGLWIVDLRMRIGSAAVRMGGIAGVHTAEKHRMKGYARRVMEYSIGFMRAKGYDVSILFGIEDFYHRWGFAPCLVGTRGATAVKNLPSDRPQDYKVRRLKKKDLPTLLRWYNRANRSRSGTVVRSPKTWVPFRIGSEYSVKPIVTTYVDRAARPAGYVSYNLKNDQMFVVEVGYRNCSLFPDMTRHLAQVARKAGAERIIWLLPFDEPFLMFLRDWGCDVQCFYPRNGAGMGRILRQNVLFDKLAPELSWRLKRAGSDFSGVCAIETEEERTLLGIGNGEVERITSETKPDVVLNLPERRLIQLVMGYRPFDLVCLDNAVRVRGRGAKVFATLFPPTEPFMWRSDHF